MSLLVGGGVVGVGGDGVWNGRVRGGGWLSRDVEGQWLCVLVSLRSGRVVCGLTVSFW